MRYFNLKTFKKVAIISFAIAPLGIVLGYFYGNYITRPCHSKESIRYCSNFLRGAENTALILIKDNRENEIEFADYHKKVASGENPTFDFPLKTLSSRSKVCMEEFHETLPIVKVRYVGDDAEVITGWVYEGCLYVSVDDMPLKSKKEVELY